MHLPEGSLLDSPAIGPCLGLLGMETPVLAALCVPILTNYAIFLDVYKRTFHMQHLFAR